MRVLANMRVFVPCDAVETKKVTAAAAKIWGPCYLRFTREKTPVITVEETVFQPGKTQIFWLAPAGKKADCVLIACGPLVHQALLAARELEAAGVNTIVLNCHTIKPLDEKGILAVVKKCGAAVTVEEHQVTGGLGGAVAELLTKNHPAPMEFIGMQNTFGESGKPSELIEKYGMGKTAIKEAVQRVIKRKNV